MLQDELGVTDDELARLSSGGAGPSRLGESTATALSKSRLGASTRRFPLAESMLGKSTVEAREGGLVMHNKAMQYEKVVSTLNQRRLRKEPFELCQAFEATVKNDAKYPLLPKAYNILAHLTQEPSLRDASGAYNSSAAPVLERQYAQAYYADRSSNSHSLLAGRLALGARQSLEHDFELYIDDKISKNPKEAALGGVPGITNKVRAFVDVTLRGKEAQDAYRPETVGGIKLWAQVYYLLRCGYTDEAAQLVETHHGSVKKDDWSFTACFKAYLSSPDRRLPKNLRDQLYNDFNGHIRSNANVDQFKFALYKIVGRFDMNRKTAKVAATTEDWVWLQLMLTRENKDGDAPQEQYDLADVAKQVLSYGSDRFDDKGRRPFTWFNLLLYTGQFERAVAYLYSKKELKTDAVHIAIALQYYGLLRAPSTTADADIRECWRFLRFCSTDTAVTVDEGSDTAYLNFGRLIELYIGPFHRIEPQAALQYAYLVALASDAPAPTGENQRQLALALVRDIVITSRSWSKLLGSVRADGSKETGVIERDLELLHLSDEQDYLQSVVLAAADQASADASLADSVELYHLAGAYDKVVETVNRALGHSLGQASGAPFTAAQTPASVGLSGAFGGATDLESLASRVHAVYGQDLPKRSRIAKRNWDTLEVLLKLKLALSQFGADRPDLALETFRSTGLLPLDNDTTQIARYAQRFREILDQPVVSNLDDVIITTMKCLHRLSQQLKDSPYGDHGRMQQLSSYKHQAQCLIQFASTLRLRLGPDVYRQLSSMSAFF